MQVGSPTLPTLRPSAKTELVVAFNLAECPTHGGGGLALGNKCGVFLCLSPEIGMLFANTVLKCPFLKGVEQCVASLSPFLAMGLVIPIFMDNNNVLL